MNTECWTKFPNFKATEFKCGCGCEKQAEEMDCALLFILQSIRNKWGRVDVTSGHRCQTYNDSLDGSIKNSDHIKYKAADFRVFYHCSAKEYRLEIMKYAMQLPGFKYAYCDGYMIKNGKIYTYSASWMGKAIHISVQ